MTSKRIEKHIRRGLWYDDHGPIVVVQVEPGQFSVCKDGQTVIIHGDLSDIEAVMRSLQPNLSRWKLCAQETEPPTAARKEW